MGSGKTYKAIQQMKNTKNNFIYVTPFLDEVDRVTSQVENAFAPESYFYKDYCGEVVAVSKRNDCLKKASNKQNIVTTHSLFTSLHKSDYEFFKNYDLILDEVIKPIQLINMTRDDLEIAFNSGTLTLNEETRNVTFTGDDYHGEYYSLLKKYCETANVTLVNDNQLVWSYPVEIFNAFNSITILTYLFEGSLLSSYFKYNGIEYSINNVSEEEEKQIKNNVKKNLFVYAGNCNKYGDMKNAFCVNWIKRRKSKELKKIKNSVANLLYRIFKTKSEETAFTTFKEFSGKLKGKGYSRVFIPVNERATNKYSDIKTMIYLANRYINPNEIEYFRSKGVEVDQDKWALAELLQWIWRGSIRKNEPMNLYIPSKRMRDLLFRWLNNEY